ncbi:MAG TPA: response regulator [Rhodanobacteraceae bacterium]|nr:response regulator [Rhodanobacteraceae bacterium]
MDTEARQFEVLLAEDDTISRAFLCDAIRTCGGAPTACTDGVTALQRARAGDWDLLIFDHHLPGLNGDAVLAALRADPRSVSRYVPAIATTADADSAGAALLRAGFAQVLPKPLSLEMLQATLISYGCHAGPLDDDGALRVCGSPSAVERLRRLFAEQELPQVQDEFSRHREDHRALRPTLHRLRASCGFCGATALASASEALHSALAMDSDAGRIDAALLAFDAALRETRTALHAKLDGSS